MWEHPETEVEAVHLGIALAYHGLLRISPRAETSDTTPCASINFIVEGDADSLPFIVSLPTNGPPALSLSALIWRYVRQFVKMDAKEALQYVSCVCLSADQGAGVGKEQVESVWELVRRIIVLANTGAAWEEVVGGFRPDGTRFVSSCSLFSKTSLAEPRIYRVALLNKLLLSSSSTTLKSTTSKFSTGPPRTPTKMTVYPRLSNSTTLQGITIPLLLVLHKHWATQSRNLVQTRSHGR